MFERKYKPYFETKSCDICGEKAILFRCIKDKHYFLCNASKCSFTIKVRHGWHSPTIRK